MSHLRPALTFLVAVTALLLLNVASAAPATAAPYIGNWLLEGTAGFDYLALEPNGRCQSTTGESGGGAFLGVHCSYTVSGNVISINETWDNSGIRNRLPQPALMQYEPKRDVLRAPHAPKQDEYHRTTKTEEEVYEAKRK
jgi:hypothetical protein